MVLLQHLTDGEEVAQGLGHLLAIDGDHPAVQPRLGVRLTGGRLALGDLVFVVRKLQIVTAAVDIKRIPQAAGGHHRALDMPTRTPITPRRRPAWFTRFSGLPQDEIQWILLRLARLDARADAQVFNLAP